MKARVVFAAAVAVCVSSCASAPAPTVRVSPVAVVEPVAVEAAATEAAPSVTVAPVEPPSVAPVPVVAPVAAPVEPAPKPQPVAPQPAPAGVVSTHITTCTQALTYLAANAAPGFALRCGPGAYNPDMSPAQAMTCISHPPECAVGVKIIVIAVVCDASVKNEAYNSRLWSDSQQRFVGAIDPYGYCR